MHQMEDHTNKPFYFNYFVAGVLGLNIYLYISLLLFGHTTILQNLLTADTSKVFSLLMMISVLGLLFLYRKVELSTIWEKLFYWLTFLYLVTSVIYHGQSFKDPTLLYFTRFPSWLSLILVLFNAYFIYLLCNLKRRS